VQPREERKNDERREEAEGDSEEQTTTCNAKETPRGLVK